MAGPGTDAAEGDGSRSADSSSRLTGWRVPSVVPTESVLPSVWIDPQPALLLPLPDAIDAAPEPATTLLEAGDPGGTTFGQPTALRQGPRWFLRRRTRRTTPDDAAPVDAAAAADGGRGVDTDVDLDLVALDEEERVWTDRALAALEEPDEPDAWMSGPEAIGSPAASRATTDPWSELTEALEIDDDDDSPAADRDQPTELDLEAEFWN